MIIDFHVHGKIKKKYNFDKDSFLLTIEEAKSEGLDSLAITEHCHSNNFFEGYEFLNENYQLLKDYYDVNGFKVFYGMEITTEQELDILVIANPNLIIKLREEIMEHLNNKEFINIKDLFKISNVDKALIILAHPYRDHVEIPNLDDEIINKIDAIELNATDLYKNGIDKMTKKVLILSKVLNLPVVYGSDTHYYIQMGSIKNIFKVNPETIKDIKESIKTREYYAEISSNLIIRVKSAAIIKKLICKKVKAEV